MQNSDVRLMHLIPSYFSLFTCGDFQLGRGYRSTVPAPDNILDMSSQSGYQPWYLYQRVAQNTMRTMGAGKEIIGLLQGNWVHRKQSSNLVSCTREEPTNNTHTQLYTQYIINKVCPWKNRHFIDSLFVLLEARFPLDSFASRIC